MQASRISPSLSRSRIKVFPIHRFYRLGLDTDLRSWRCEVAFLCFSSSALACLIWNARGKFRSNLISTSDTPNSGNSYSWPQAVALRINIFPSAPRTIGPLVSTRAELALKLRPRPRGRNPSVSTPSNEVNQERSLDPTLQMGGGPTCEQRSLRQPRRFLAGSIHLSRQ